MLLLIAFACFFVLFAAWLLVPNADETKVKPDTAEAPASTGAIPARA